MIHPYDKAMGFYGGTGFPTSYPQQALEEDDFLGRAIQTKIEGDELVITLKVEAEVRIPRELIQDDVAGSAQSIACMAGERYRHDLRELLPVIALKVEQLA